MYAKLFVAFYSASARGNERRDFLEEIEMMKKVSEGQNPHIVSMVGCVTLQEPLSLITEFVPFGNLLQYLRTSRKMVMAVLISGIIIVNKSDTVAFLSCTWHNFE